jgi:hypothetical protein
MTRVLFLIDAWSNKKNKAHVAIMVGMPILPVLGGAGREKRFRH